MKLRTLGVLLLAACQSTSVAWADGLIRDGVGPISTGRGGTNQAFADNSAIIMDNPGGMVNVAGSGLAELGVDTAITSVHYTNPLNDVDSKTRPLPLPVLGFIHKSDDEQWAYGLGVFVPAGFGASYGVMNQAVLGPNLYRSIGGMGKVLPGLSYRVTDRLSVGATVGLAFSDVNLQGPYFVQTGAFAGAPAVVDLTGFGVAPTGSLGMQYRVDDDTMIGATYTEQSNFKLHGGANAALALGPGVVLPSHFDSIMNMCWPRSVAVGIKHDLCPHRRISADVIWYDWAHAFDSIGLSLSNPTNPLVPAVLGTSTINDQVALNWRNSVALRLGYEWMPDDINTWRVGYAYHGGPAPNSTLSPFLDGILENAFSVGYSRQLSRAALNLAYQYNFGPTRSVGTSSIVGGDFSNSTMNAQAHFAMVSLLFPF
ncbi:MAG TPA: outer membrane protein transport protein [Pirellulales bacterium]|jgi:long-subunit fatty acid transport protein|nr:outer membrane protein transport protein [Pirellulales bacterium]